MIYNVNYIWIYSSIRGFYIFYIVFVCVKFSANLIRQFFFDFLPGHLQCFWSALKPLWNDSLKLNVCTFLWLPVLMGNIIANCGAFFKYFSQTPKCILRKQLTYVCRHFIRDWALKCLLLPALWGWSRCK